jgi:hypothetical protein
MQQQLTCPLPNRKHPQQPFVKKKINTIKEDAATEVASKR